VPSICTYVRRSLIIAREEGLRALLNRAHRTLNENLRRFFSRARLYIGDLAKATVMLAVLRPAADFLPAHWAYALADLCGKLNALTPFYGKEIVESIGIVFDKDHQEASLISRELLSRPFRDYVVLRRILRNREDFRKWDVVEINGSLVQRLRETRAPFILATGHFARWAAVPLFLERVIPHRFTVIAAPIIKNRSLNPKALWLRHHLGQMTTYMKHVRPDTAFVNPGQSGLMKELARCLTRPGNVLFTSLDAPWGGRPRGSFIRPFASVSSPRR